MRCPSFLPKPLQFFLLSLFLLSLEYAGGEALHRGGAPLSCIQWGPPRSIATASRGLCRRHPVTFLWLPVPPEGRGHGACSSLRRERLCRNGEATALFGSPQKTLRGGGAWNDAGLACSAEPTAGEAASALCRCKRQGIQNKAVRKWLSLAKYLKAAPTGEDRLRRLMQLGLQDPAAPGAPNVHQGATQLVLQGDGSTRRDLSATTDAANAEAWTPASSSTSKDARGFLFVGPKRPVVGCAASASITAALLPGAPGVRSLSNTSKGLCCTAASQGTKIYAQGASDSLVVGGLLQLLLRGLNGGPPCDVWALEALGISRLLQRSGLLGLLPNSRIRGLRGALEALMDITRDLLQQLFAAGGDHGRIPQETVANWGPMQSSLTAQPKNGPHGAAPAATDDGEILRETTAGSEAVLGVTPRLLQGHPGSPILSPVGPPGSLLLQDAETAAWAEKSRVSLPAIGGAGAEVQVLVSGGVDSSVSLLLLREWGFRPKPVFLKVWAPEAAQLQHQHQQGALAAAAAAAAACPWEKDAEAARAAAAAAGCSLEVLPMQKQYWERVISAFLEGAKKGLTLNPDWSCNSSVKFGAFAEALGGTQVAIASGHYASVRMDNGEAGVPRLFRGADGLKDQSYFLSGLSTHQLSRMLLPLGPLLKTQVRQLALRWGLPSAQRPDSQGLCFLGPLAVGPFLTHLLGEMEGPVLHFPSGASLGRHKGLWGFTAGQQKGVVPVLFPSLCRRCRGASGVPPTLSGPWSVVGKAPEANALFVVSREEEAAAEARVRALAPANGKSSEQLGGPLLDVAARGDPGALLALKLRQLRTHLRVDNIRWIGGLAPPEFTDPAARAHQREHRPDSVVSAAAAAAVAAAQQGTAILSGKPVRMARGAPLNAEGELVVQVRHSAAFDGIAKHKFKILWTSTEGPGVPGVTAVAELLLEEPDVGLAPGQVAAFYRGDECLGSGHISALQGLSLLREALQKAG